MFWWLCEVYVRYAMSCQFLMVQLLLISVCQNYDIVHVTKKVGRKFLTPLRLHADSNSMMGLKAFFPKVLEYNTAIISV